MAAYNLASTGAQKMLFGIFFRSHWDNMDHQVVESVQALCTIKARREMNSETSENVNFAVYLLSLSIQLEI